MPPWGFGGFGKKDKPEGGSAPPVQALVGAFGKVPKMGDFLRAGGKPLLAFEQWLEGAMAFGEKKHGAQWPAVYGRGAVHAFTFRPPRSDGALLVGILKPSHDAVGRRFPFIVFAQIPERATSAYPHLLPLVLGDFLEAATAMAAEGDNATSASQFEATLARLAPPALDADHAAGEYDAWARGSPVRAAWSAIYGDPESDAALYALKAIRDALHPFAEQENLTTTLGLRLPLGGGGVAAAAFWLDVIRRAAKWRSTTPTFFWAEGSILVQLGVTPPSSLAELWQPDYDSDFVFDLTSPTTLEHRSKLLASFPRELAARLASGDTPVGDILGLLDR